MAKVELQAHEFSFLANNAPSGYARRAIAKKENQKLMRAHLVILLRRSDLLKSLMDNKYTCAF
jgi:hypothetical protein